ncbi:MAG: hypothetical protein AABW68_00510 [archaeon]
MQTPIVFFILLIGIATAVFPSGVAADEPGLLEIAPGVWKAPNTAKNEYNETFYLYDSLEGDSYQITVHEQSEYAGGVHSSILMEFGKYVKNNTPTLAHNGYSFPIPEENRIVWISGQNKITITGPVDPTDFSSKIIDYLLDLYPYTNIESKVDEYLQTVEDSAENSKLPTNFPDVVGYSIFKTNLIEDNGNFNQVTYADDAGSYVYVNMYESADATNMDALFSLFNKDGGETTIFSQSNIFLGEGSEGKFVVWQSAPFIVRVRYQETPPAEVVEAYLDIFPPKEYGYGDKLSDPEKINLLYTSDLFENPPGYIDILANSVDLSIVCNQSPSQLSGADIVEKVLTSTNYPLTPQLLADAEESCQETGHFVRKALPISSVIAACQEEVAGQFEAAGIKFNDEDALQECLIESYSLENYLQSGGSEAGYAILVKERIPVVIELLKEKYAKKVVCDENLVTGESVNCQTTNEEVESTTTIQENGEEFTITSTENQKILEENEINPIFVQTLVVIDGREIILREPIKVVQNKIVVNDEPLIIIPSEVSEIINRSPDVRKVEVSKSDAASTYSLEVNKKSKLLFFIPVEFSLIINGNSKDNSYRVEQPWWAVLAT